VANKGGGDATKEGARRTKEMGGDDHRKGFRTETKATTPDIKERRKKRRFFL